MGEGFLFLNNNKSSPYYKVPSIMKRGGFLGMTDRVCWLYLNCEVLGPWNHGHVHKEMLSWDLGSHRFPGTAAVTLREFASLW